MDGDLTKQAPTPASPADQCLREKGLPFTSRAGVAPDDVFALLRDIDGNLRSLLAEPIPGPRKGSRTSKSIGPGPPNSPAAKPHGTSG